MFNIPLDTKQVISGTLFTANLLTSTENSEKLGKAKYKN